MIRYLGTFFRIKWLLLTLLALLLSASLVGTYVLSSKNEYESAARIWVDLPVLDSVLNQGSYSNAAPAAQQSGKLYQLLQTDSFILAIIQRTRLQQELSGDSAQNQALIVAVRAKLAIDLLGGNTLRIGFTSTDPALCQQVVQAVIDQFRMWTREQQGEARDVELQYYTLQLRIYEQLLNDATSKLADFQRNNPNPQPNSTESYQFVQLQREVEGARSTYAAQKTRLDQITLERDLSDKNKQSEFQLLDKPTLPEQPVRSLKKAVQYLVMGVAASLSFMVAILILATWLDTTVRSAADLQRLGAPPVLQVFPPLLAVWPRDRADKGRRRRRRGHEETSPVEQQLTVAD